MRLAVTWFISGSFDDNGTLAGIPFDGGILGGSFVYDADINTYSDVNIFTTTGRALPGLSAYPNVDASDSDASNLTVFERMGDLNGSRGLFLAFASGLTNAGGTVLLAGRNAEVLSLNSTCNSSLAPRILILDGTAKVTTVPIPAGFWLFSSGLGLLGWVIRRA